MKPGYVKTSMILALLIGFSSVTPAMSAQTPSPDTVPVSVVVSVEAKHGKDVPAVTREDVRVFKGRDRLQVTDWVPLQADKSGLELFVLIDEASGANVASQFDDLRRFMEAQPSTTAIAVGYLQYGTVMIAQNFTTDHSAAGKALRIPVASLGAGSGPYLSIADAIKRWPESPNRRAIFLISDGIDPLQPGIVDSYLDAAIAQAQRTGTQISSIYFSRGGHMGHTFWRINQGQTNLSRLSDESGGEGYFEGFGNPVAFSPFLEEFADRLNHQYKLTFTIKPDKKAEYQHIRLETEVPNAELVTADKVYVPATK
jgi:hypothetical protein